MFYLKKEKVFKIVCMLISLPLSLTQKHTIRLHELVFISDVTWSNSMTSLAWFPRAWYVGGVSGYPWWWMLAHTRDTRTGVPRCACVCAFPRRKWIVVPSHTPHIVTGSLGEAGTLRTYRKGFLPNCVLHVQRSFTYHLLKSFVYSN